MKFLKKIKSKDGAEIEVKRVLKVTVQCEDCQFWGKMDGGVTSDGKGAVFACPECGTINRVKWEIDI